MRKLVSKGLVMMAGILAVPGSADPEQQRAEIPTDSALEQTIDPRLLKLQKFFTDHGAPASRFSQDFLIAADQNNLDWRLLPTISLLESGGGKKYRNNNIFGWANCERRFPSVQYGIYLVARRLSTSKLYRDKNLDEILATYNPRREYGHRVRTVMARLGPAEPW